MVNTQAVLIANAIVEILSGLVVLFWPAFLFPFSTDAAKNQFTLETWTLASHWFGFAIIAIGSFSAYVVSKSDEVQQAAAFAFFIYHGMVSMATIIRLILNMQVDGPWFSNTMSETAQNLLHGITGIMIHLTFAVLFGICVIHGGMDAAAFTGVCIAGILISFAATIVAHYMNR